MKEFMEGGEADAIRKLQSFVRRNVLCCAACWYSYRVRLLREVNFHRT